MTRASELRTKNELISGELPIRGSGPISQIRNIMAGDFIPLRERVPSVPERVETVLNGALASNPDERYPDAQTFLTALQGLADCV